MYTKRTAAVGRIRKIYVAVAVAVARAMKMSCLTASIAFGVLPQNRVVSWVDLLGKEKIEDPTFVANQPESSTDIEEDSDTEQFKQLSQPHILNASDESNSASENYESEPDTATDPELEALKKRFEKYLTNKKDQSIDVGSYDTADPFIDDAMDLLEVEEKSAENGSAEFDLNSLQFMVVDWNATLNTPNTTITESSQKRTKAIDTKSKEKKHKKQKHSQPSVENEEMLASQPVEGVISSTPTESSAKAKNIDYELDIAKIEHQLAVEAFVAIAGQKTISDKTKFPASLQFPLWNVVKWQILSNEQRIFDENALASLVSRSLPFSPGSVRKLLFKVIFPEMIAKMVEENRTTTQSIKSSLQAKLSAMQPVPTENTALTTIDDEVSRLLYEQLKGEFDLYYVRSAITRYEEPSAVFASDVTYRRAQYLKLQADLDGLLASSFISSQYTKYKRRVWRKLCKQLV